MLGAAPTASAIGDITCETPTVTGVVTVVPLTADPADDVALSKVAETQSIGVIRVPDSNGGGERLDECVVGPLPPTNAVQSGPGGGPDQAYVEHGLSENASWRGFRFELALPAGGIPDGGSLTLLSVDFDTAAGLGDQYRVAVKRTGSATELVLVRAGEQAAVRLPLGVGDVVLSWGGSGLTIAHAGASATATLAPGSRARAVRLGYLGVDAAQAQPAGVYVVDPTFTAN